MAKKTLRQILEEFSEGKEVDVRTRNYATFVSLKNEIAEAMSDGWSVMKIWKALKQEGRIDFEYPVLSRYVRRYLRGRQDKGVDALKNKEAGKSVEPEKKAMVTPQGRVLPDWPKPGARQSSEAKIGGTYRGEMPVYGSKPKPEDFNKF